ncbi:MAG: 4Fe-4S binding protein [Chloroflexi bacterium]|nr:4Fe-4S binding protein [Chloroflexota bacterium]
MVDAREMELVVVISDQILALERIADLLGLDYAQAFDLVQRAYSRCILNKVVEDGIIKYTSANFYARLDHFAKFENWHDIPVEHRQLIHRSFLDEFINRHKANVERKMSGLEAENALPNDTVMLLSEVEDMIDAATDIIVQPCDCRKLGENCDKPVETCIWLDEGARQALDRGHGRQLTKGEAKTLLRWADKKGLMHTADSEWGSRGLHAICNCCACDCYPFQAAQELGSKGVWPKSRYVAAHDPDLCDSCGACVKRCHFEAFYHDGSITEVDGKNKNGVQYDPEKCWGCGLCANTCPEGAIVMTELVDC